MKSKQLSSKALTEQTLESEPRSLPKQISQSRIQQNHKNICTIPVVAFPNCIRQLYLSHNRISTLEGIEAFINLQSINLSYNCIARAQELRRIHSPQILKHLKIRMNPLPYGYEDYFVSIFRELQTFEDIKLTKENQELQFIMRKFISSNILCFYTKSQLIIRTLSTNQDKQNQNNRSNQVTSRRKDQTIQNALSAMILGLKKTFIFPTQETLRNMSITQLLTTSSEIVKSVIDVSLQKTTSDEYVDLCNKGYQQIFESILVKFSARHDKSLINHLHQIKKSQDSNLIHAFARVGVFEEAQTPMIQASMSAGGNKSPLLTDNPAKSIKKIQKESLINHPMNKMANWECPEYNTLIPWEQTKFHRIYEEVKQQEQADYLYEKVPVFIFCKEYLEVITQLILDRTADILLLENSIKQMKDPTKQATLNTESKTFTKPYIIDDSLELELSLSDTMSFGKQDTLPTHQIQINHQQTIPYQHGRTENYKCNVSKYSLYEINLAFKVFCTLKKRVKRKIKRAGILR